MAPRADHQGSAATDPGVRLVPMSTPSDSGLEGAPESSTEPVAALLAEVASLRAEVSALRAEVADLRSDGTARPGFRNGPAPVPFPSRDPKEDAGKRSSTATRWRGSATRARARIAASLPRIDASRLPRMHHVALLLGILGQWVISSRLELFPLPPAFVDDLKPVWPDPAPVVAGIALFLLAMPLYGYAVGRRACGTPWPRTHPSFQQRRPLDEMTLALGGAGLLVMAWVNLRLATTAYQPAYPRWYALSLALLLASLVWHERGRFHIRGRASRRVMLRLVPELGSVIVMLTVFVYLNTFDLTHWRYSAIGDEGAFYHDAKLMAEGQDVLNLFTQQGVYGKFPLLSTYLVSQLMRVLGTDGVGWKTATLVPVVIALALGYVLARSLYGRRTALLFLGFSVTAHYLLALAHTGYNNLDPLLASLGALLCLVLGLRHTSRLLLVVSGVFAGLGWYMFYSARTVIVILGVAILLTVRPRSWIPSGLAVAAGFAMLVVPFFVVNKGDVIRQMLIESGAGNNREAVANERLLLLWNTGRSLLAFNYNTKNYLYTSGSLAEPVTAALFVLGLGYAMMTWTDARSRLLLAWFGIGIIATGVFSKYDHVAVTRLSYVLPVVVLLAAVAVDRSLAAWRPPKVARSTTLVMSGVVLGVIMLVGTSNLHRWFVVSPRDAPTSPTSVTMRIVQKPICQSAQLPPLVLDGRSDGALAGAVEQVGNLTMPTFRLFADPTNWLDTANARCVVLRSSNLPEAALIRNAIAARWPELEPVAETDGAGDVRILAYYPETRSNDNAAAPLKTDAMSEGKTNSRRSSFPATTYQEKRHDPS